MIGVLHAPCILCHAPLHFRRTTRHGVTLGRLFMRLGICIMRSKGDRSSVSTAREAVLHAPCVLCHALLRFRRTTRHGVTSGRLSCAWASVSCARKRSIVRQHGTGERFFMRLASCVMRYYAFDGQHGTA
ncbi:uncharacterized protein LAJ45_07230 [Morchella importuna]|uniref:uncharacterized protein n=1 Tax=Morchella importuna TaxID=1174673 RepID=UPI001E8DF9C1|nr:uncharacterized protein LAJ45_07230 [Morchella importuna]KAH8148886.1 hypothetical protein LAJ45_07230 [Morchella importuna]